MNKLIRPEVAQSLLEAFIKSAKPGSGLVLLRPDGSVLARAGEWPAHLYEGLAEALNQAKDREGLNQAGWITLDSGVQFFPLRSGPFLLGGLILKGQVPGLNGLLHSLDLLFAKGLELRELGRETLERYREINLLYHIGETIGACLNPAEIPCLVMEDAREVLRAETGAVLLSAAPEKQVLKLQDSLGDADQVQALLAASNDLVQQVFESGHPDLLGEISSEILSEIPTAKISSSVTRSVGTILCAPLKTQEHTLGVVVLGRPTGFPPFTASDQKLAMALAGQAGIAFERAWLHQQELEHQRMEEELALGRQIQLSLLPDACPALPGWEFAAHYRAANQVGGDFYDFIPLPGEAPSLGLVIADVTGKGVSAALIMASTRTLLRAEARSNPLLTPCPRDMLEHASQALYADNPSRLFLTAFYAVLSPNRGRVAYANGGHEYPLWLNSETGELRELSARSTLLGAFPSIELEERIIEVAPGDLLVFYTDGVTEARAEDDKMYGDERLKVVVTGCVGASANQALEFIVQDVRAFVGGAPQADDFTIVIARRMG